MRNNGLDERIRFDGSEMLWSGSTFSVQAVQHKSSHWMRIAAMESVHIIYSYHYIWER